MTLEQKVYHDIAEILLKLGLNTNQSMEPEVHM